MRIFSPLTERLFGRPPEMTTEVDILHALEIKTLWLSFWMIHRANAIRPTGAIKVGNHQASCRVRTTMRQ